MLLASVYLAFETLWKCEHKKWYEQETIPKASIPNPQYTATGTANFTTDLTKKDWIELSIVLEPNFLKAPAPHW